MERKNVWTSYSKEQIKELESLNATYRTFLDKGKTERECVNEAIKMAKAHGYSNLEDIIADNKKLKPGDKVYAACMKKSVIMFRVGTDPLENGIRILGAHVDSPRLDIKQNPLYEDSELAYLDTHYYGGIKKYQWVTIPLAIHGVLCKKDGSIVNVIIGEDDSDPVFCISDILIHLAQEQMDKKMAKAIEGEALDIIIGSKPLKGKEKDAVKEGILKLLNEKYQIEEDDFISAELEVVPAGKSRDAGLDSSMILGYGQDDRVCAYTSLVAMFEVEDTDKTTCCILTDKEEIGSVGATGMEAKFFENVVAELLNALGSYSDLALRRCLSHSRMLSSDVSAAFDPQFASCFEKKNSAFFGKGIVFNKYSGAKGKSGSNDANAEYLAAIRSIMDDNNVAFQTAELGRVDQGGGGTIAYILALYGMEVVDCGVAVLNMHAPWEMTSKADIYEAKKGYVAFLKEA
ncbi:MAG: aminopeptidase [Velocimicrobium sp.]